jgi:hypothetical protein
VGGELRTERVLVLGCPGAGKTTLASRLAERTGLPLHHLDDEYWGVGWERLDERSWQDRQRALVAGQQWIIDGNYAGTVSIRAARADLIVVLDTSTTTCLARVLLRATRIRRGDLSALPRRIRLGDTVGRPARATKDFIPLLRKIVGFRSHTLWQVVDAAANVAGTLVVVSGPGIRRTRAMRGHLRRRGVSALVLSLPQVIDLVATTPKTAVPTTTQPPHTRYFGRSR